MLIQINLIIHSKTVILPLKKPLCLTAFALQFTLLVIILILGRYLNKLILHIIICLFICLNSVPEISFSFSVLKLLCDSIILTITDRHKPAVSTVVSVDGWPSQYRPA